MHDTTKNHDELIELCAGYAIGALDDADRARLEAHLAGGCRECEHALTDFAVAALAIAATAPAAEPDPALKRRVLDAIATEPVATPAPARTTPPADGPSERPIAAPRRRNPWILIAGLGWAAAAAGFVVLFVQQRSLGTLTGQIAALRETQSALQRQLVEERQWSASMASPAARVAFFAPTPNGAATMSGWALYDPSAQRAVLVLENLQHDRSRDFELWAIRSDGPHSLGVIETDAGGRALVRLSDVGATFDLAAFAISDEARGGSPDKSAPAGPVVMVGSLSS